MFCMLVKLSILCMQCFCTILEIINLVGFLSRYMLKPRNEHWETIKGFFKYLCGTASYELC